jgi:hypothetical protein
MRGDLNIDETAGQRWDSALDLIERGEAGVALSEGVRVRRQFGWPGADGKVHIAVVTNKSRGRSNQAAQTQVDAAKERMGRLITSDVRFAEICQKYGVVWEYIGEGGMATLLNAPISVDGTLIWTGPQ